MRRFVDPRPCDRRWQVDRLPVLLDQTAQRIRTGDTLRQAVSAVANDRSIANDDLRRVVALAEHGLPFAAGLDRWARDLDHVDAHMVRAVLATGLSAGGALASTLEQAASSLRDRADLAREVRSLSAQARASAAVLIAAPIAFLALFCIVDSTVATVVIANPTGRAMVGVGLALDFVGWRWMRKIERSVIL